MSQQAISSVVAQPALVCLPDDVLIRILEQIGLETQLDLTHVHIRFLRLMPHVWRSQCKNINFKSIKLPMREADLCFFLGSNQETMEVLKLPHWYIFDVLTNYVFPNLHKLALGSRFVKFDSSRVLKAIKAFPNLRSFTPTGRFTGKHFEKFSQLERLTLTFCESFEASNLLRILETCKLKTLKLGIFKEKDHHAVELPFSGIQFLEVLKCNEWEMQWFIKKLNYLEHLKQIILCDEPEDIFIEKVMTVVSRKSIKCFEVNDREIDIIYIMEKVDVQIQTVKVSENWVSFFGYKQYRKAHKDIYLNECFVSDRSNLDVLFSMNICETIVMENCLFIEVFKYTINALKIVKGRRTKLNIYLYNNKCEEDLPVGVIRKQVPMKWKVFGQHPLLEVHMGQKPNISYSSEKCSILFD